MHLPEDIHIREKSWLARLAGLKLRCRKVAIVFGNTIHLAGVNKEIFLKNEAWVRHELKHIEQYRHYGFLPFILRYLLEWLRKGYYHNRFEVEAREAEKPGWR